MQKMGPPEGRRQARFGYGGYARDNREVSMAWILHVPDWNCPVKVPRAMIHIMSMRFHSR